MIAAAPSFAYKSVMVMAGGSAPQDRTEHPHDPFWGFTVPQGRRRGRRVVLENAREASSI